MRIDSISMVNVMKHTSTHVQFPQRGVLLITGKNGQGKSSFLDAVAMGLWGKTLRGKTCWKQGTKESKIIIESGSMHIERSRKGARNSLTWTNGAVGFERHKDAQAELEKVIVPFDVWRRAAIISSSDAMHFTLATDQERKKLVESISGLDVFDTMAAKARVLRKEAAARLTVAETKHVAVQVTLGALQARRDEVVNAPKPKKPNTPEATLNAESDKLRLKAESISQARIVVRENIARLTDECSRIRAEQNAARRKRDANPGTCSECGTVLDADACTRAQAELDAVLAQKTPDDLVADARAEAGRLAESADKVSKRIFEIRDELALWTAFNAAQTASDDRVRQIDAKILDEQDELDACAHNVRTLTQEHIEHQAVEQILSTKGIRASLLAEVLTVIEEAANRWFGFLPMEDGVPLKLKLSPYTEKGDSVSDALSLEVEGAGAGLGYKAASAGERRRIDLALMLALQEVAEAAHGVKFGTVFIDEAFDALDADVVPEAVELLRDLAEDRCVILITHNELVAKHLGDAMVAHMHVERGSVKYV
jgi:DNA repair exonuclease SbcCD ATPase subunit